MDHCKSLSVIAVCKCAELMLDLVRLKIRNPADLQNTVLRHGRIPHQIASRLHIVHIFKQTAHIDHSIAHHRQRQVIGNIVLIRIAKVSLHRMA